MNTRRTKSSDQTTNNFMSLNNQLEQDSTINSTENFESTRISTDSSVFTLNDGHLQNCTYKYAECICSRLNKLAEARKKCRDFEMKEALRKKYCLNFDSSDEDSDYSNNHKQKKSSVFSFKSFESPDGSFHTAETGPSQAPSTISSDTYESVPPFADLSNCSNEPTFNVIHETSNNQSIIDRIEERLYSHLKNETNSSTTKKIEPFFKRLSIIAQNNSNDNSLTECLIDTYEICQQDPHEFVSKLSTIIEEITLPVDNSSAIVLFQEILTKFKSTKIQDESLPSFIKIISPIQPPEELLKKKIDRSTPKVLKSSQASPLFISTMTRLIETNNETPKSTCKSLSRSESPSTPLSNCETSKHNESTFTYLEHKYVGEDEAVEHLKMLALTKEEKRSLLLCKKQSKALEESPSREETNEVEDSILDSPCSIIVNHNEINSHSNTPCLASVMARNTKFCPSPCSPSFESTKAYESPSNVDVDESILHEYVTQRRRCFETEKTIREIQAAFSQTTGINSNLLNVLTECSDYQEAIKIDKKPTPNEKGSKASMKNTGKEKSGLNIDSKTSTPKNTQITKKKGVSVTQSEKKLPGLGKSLSQMKIKSPETRISTKSPARQAQNLNMKSSQLSVHQKSRSPSPSLVVSRKKTKPRSPTLLTVKKLGALKTPIKASNIRESETIPKIAVVPSTPSCTSSPLVELTDKYKNYIGMPVDKSPVLPPATPTFMKPHSRRKYFPSPNQTPVKKEKLKIKYFATPESLKENTLKFENVRSPVGDYIHGKNMILLQNVRSKTNEDLLLQNNKIFNSKLTKKENDENRPATTFPHVYYEKPSAVYEISQTQKVLGTKRKMLEEVKNSHLVIRHEGRVTPEVIENMNADFSIHVTKVAERTAFHLKKKNG